MFHDGGLGPVALNSPWDLAYHKSKLYIAMAGFHQLWVMDLESGHMAPFAGSGREGISDGPLGLAMLAQPTGIDTDGEVLYFADSETSSIRTASLNGTGNVISLVGTGLFDFGDRDGIGDQAKLQHVQGVCYHEGVLYLADTYNNKIRKLYPDTREVVSFLGLGDPGLEDGSYNEALFYEPEGVAVAEGKLFIADTNNHVIRVGSLETSEVSTLELKD